MQISKEEKKKVLFNCIKTASLEIEILFEKNYQSATICDVRKGVVLLIGHAIPFVTTHSGLRYL
jgi:hypothetical protein